MMAGSRPITKWNVLALLVLMAGAAAVIGVDQWRLTNWSNSGQAFAIGEKSSVRLAPGRSLVYYESPQAVPDSNVTMDLRNPQGERLRFRAPANDISYSLLLSGWCGRALWEIDIEQEGEYTFTCHNHNFASDRDRPAEDRIVFLKQPDSLAEVSGRRKTFQISGASVVLAMAAGCYVMHGRELHRKKRKGS